jgi:outer membrane protein assembly factor BamD (BamD/ComL family)
MRFKFLSIIIWLIFLAGCSKTATEYFELAEASLNENQVEIAIENLEILVEKYARDSLAALAQYKLAAIHLNWKNDLPAGFAALEKTVNEYGSTLQARKAQKEIVGFPEWILNQSESLRKRKMIKESLGHLMYLTEKYSNHRITPKGQYLIGDIYMNDLRDFTTAIQEYRKVSEKHKGSDQEPHAQFMIGYIFANVINDFESAKIEYDTFLKIFPEHELVPSVQFEIEYLGKNINEIPALKHITS